MLIKHLPFLVGVLVPLNLTMCVHLKNRDYDFVVLRAEGEGAIGALIGDLGAAGIVVDTAGPGQHVAVVERKIQTVKSLVRANNISLPYVMHRLRFMDELHRVVRRYNSTVASFGVAAFTLHGVEILVVTLVCMHVQVLFILINKFTVNTTPLIES
jgi:hypothetical protein